MKIRGINRHISSFQIIILGFFLVIIIGCCLLMLPISTIDGKGASFFDALFTSVSATCVTGLTVHNTAEYWSVFGQIVIILLIQIGGMGVVTIGIAVAMFSGRRIGLMQRSTMKEAIAAYQVGGIVELTGFILRTTAIIELTGAIVMAPSFWSKFGFGRGLWYAVFHSISAFCNAGFDLMGNEMGSSLMGFSANPWINFPVMLLIIIGGIGFLTWDDIRKNKTRFRKYRMQSKVILLTTALLIVLPTIYFFFFEFNKEQWGNMSIMERFLTSVFQAVTPRTAGFNTVDLQKVSEPGQFIMISLMLIGGVSGSTAGGFKVNTLAILLMTTFAVFRRKSDAQCFGRRISSESVYNAITIFVLYLVLFLSGGIIISSIEHIPLLTAFYETASAIGTVGLSIGITSQLGIISRFLLILFMFFGRVGGLTLIFAVVSGKRISHFKYPEEKITVG
ncbi:MAG: Trk family potassium uptake protein [Clostridiales bacterium]|nr:Trk family potassium uptake protein [Clostridiales bacterium]